MEKLKFLFSTRAHTAGLVCRLTLAAVLLPHGCQLLFGWFGGSGFNASMNYFTDVENLPWLVGFSVIMIQFLGSILLIIGATGRLMGIAVTFMFLGMIATSHWEHGFFMNWFGNQKGEGFEYHILVLGLAIAIWIEGSGKFSVDQLILSNFKDKN